MTLLKKGFFAATAMVVSTVPALALAAGDYGIGPNQGVQGANNVSEVIAKIVKLLLSFVGGLSVLIIVIAGILYITSGGDEGRTESAKKWIIYAIVGLIVSLLAWVIVNTVIKEKNDGGGPPRFLFLCDMVQ